MNIDGWITIGTKFNTEKFDKQYETLKKKLQDQEAKINLKVEGINQAKEDLKKLQEEFDAIAQEAEVSELDRYFELKYKNREGLLTDEEESEWFNIAKMADAYEDIQKQIERKATLIEDTQQKIENENQGLEEEKRNYAEILNEIEKVNQAKGESIRQQTFSSIQNSVDNIGKSVQNVTKKVIRWGLAIFGVRSAYMFVRQAMSTLSQYDKQLATDIQYIRFALASTLKPLIESIIKLVYTLLQYLGYVIKQLFGINIFKNAGIDKFQEGMAKSAKSAKEIKNQLAGFDEMNVLQDTSNKGANEDENIAPSIDLSKLKNQKVPKWLDSIVKFGKWVLKNWKDVVFLLLMIKMFIDLITGNWLGFVIDLVALLVVGFLKLWDTIKDLIKVFDILYKEFKKVLDNMIKWLNQKMEETYKKYGYFAGLIVKSIKDQVKNIRDTLDTAYKNIQNIFKNIKDFINNVFSGEWKKAWQNLMNIALSVWNIFVNDLTFKINTIKNVITGAFGAIGDVISGILRGAINIVFKFIEGKINDAIGMFNNVLSVVNKLSPVKINKIPKVSLPRLAQGGIINYPSKGVPIGGAIGGERGAEGVIPLTDSQQMALLGEAIGKYITINANIINTMNGRVISREIQKVQNQTNFATNGR